MEVFVVVLRYDAVDEFASHLAGTSDEQFVGRRCHDERDVSNMFGESAAGFTVPFHLLLSVLEYAGCRGGLTDISFVVSVNSKKCLTVANVLAVDGVEMAFTERKVIDCIEEISLANAVVADEAIDTGRGLDLDGGVVFEIGKIYTLEIHLESY